MKLVGVLATLLSGCVATTAEDPEGTADHAVDDAPDSWQHCSPENGSISGTIYDQAGAPIPNVIIFVWVWSGLPSAERGGAGAMYGHTTSDANGRYTKSCLPSTGTAMLQMRTSGYMQPCVTQQPYASGSTIDGLLHSTSYLAAGGAPPANASPLITGTVTDASTGAGIAGAMVWVELADGNGLVGGITTTDSTGHYFVCRIPERTLLQYAASGYASDELYAPNADATIDRALTK